MRYLILLSLVLQLFLQAEVINVIPYSGMIKYDTNSDKSIKDNSYFGGVYASIGTLNYLVEAAYNFTTIQYKNSIAIENLNQHDAYLKYSAFYDSVSYNLGLHVIQDNEQEIYRDLGSGYVTVFGIGGYNYFAQSKITYGLDAYYSLYIEAHNDLDRNRTTTIDILQVTPYFMYAQTLDYDMSNTILLRVNLQEARRYQQSTYFSYELVDTFYYHSVYTILKYMGGKMKSGVLNGGITVYNTKDLLHDSYNIKVGYYFNPNFTMDIMFGRHTYQEYDSVNLKLLEKGASMSSVISMGYSF